MKVEIVIFKSKKLLEIIENGKLIKTYTIAVGRNEDGQKQKEGDLRTPEGEYRICVKNPKSKYHLSLGINYPNTNDAVQGLKKGVITQQEYQTICDADSAAAIPPWKTALGGEIYIHGNLEQQNWTHGCIRMLDKDIEELYIKTPVGTKVIIKA